MIYSEAKPLMASVSAARGTAEYVLFGTITSYDKVIITDDMNCQMDEQSILFVDKRPEFDEYDNPLGDYVVKRVARSLNHISYAVSKVEMS